MKGTAEGTGGRRTMWHKGSSGGSSRGRERQPGRENGLGKKKQGRESININFI